jgi:hypothetical protein
MMGREKFESYAGIIEAPLQGAGHAVVETAPAQRTVVRTRFSRRMLEQALNN